MKFMEGGNRFKIGLFGFLHESANTVTLAPERWSGTWADIEAMARAADESGIDFLLPYARWKGIPGTVASRLHSFENLTAISALAGMTKRIGVFATVHTTIMHPIVTAKMLVTLDHASGGRAGVNIVCGWNQADFDMFGITQLEHDERYRQGAEWFEIWSRLAAGAPEPFDYSGVHFRNLLAVTGMPGSIQRPFPLVLNAAYSPAGREFAVRVSDYLMTIVEREELAAQELADIRAREAKVPRQTPLRVLCACYVVCRPTRQEAQDFHHYYAVEQADQKALDYWVQARTSGGGSIPAEIMRQRTRIAGGNSNMPLIGSPQDIAEQMIELARIGYAGAALSFYNFGAVPYFAETVLPILRRAGLRGETT
jgi:alkanesulfonate monooxygenase SsuD/methylene tetrahydromethanopterin reductase-like flavin-dependent oxidoreductase (luciferase family)